MDDRYVISDQGYGKSFVKVLHVYKDGLRHSIREFEVNTTLKLNSQIDYKFGDNRDIVATDTQKNTVYLLAKKYGITTPEEFGMLLCKHFLETYKQVIEVSVKIEACPWERIVRGEKSHNHAFVLAPVALRTAYVTQKRNGDYKIKTGLSNLTVLKTTQSSFEKFFRNDYATLPDAADRVFSTSVNSLWEYSTSQGIDFDNAWDTVKDIIFEKFAGNPQDGIASPSVQHTLYLAEKSVLDRIQQVSKIEMVMPNKHYFGVDFNKFPSHLTSGDSKIEILQPVDKPSGMIRAELSRKITSKL